MEKDFYIALIYKQIECEISETELEQLNQWISESAENQALAEDLRLALDVSSDYLVDKAESVDVNAAFAEQMQLIENEITTEQPKNEAKTVPIEFNHRRIFRIISAAAAVLVLAFIGMQYLEYRTQAEAIVSTENEAKTIDLVDGSIVVLAPNSTIKYSNYFNEKGRFVELVKGEAEFSVVKEKGTFRVKTNREMVTVLGTVFKVQFGESQSTISVSEGKVNVRQNATEKGQTDLASTNLVAGEQVVSTNKSLVKTKADNEQKINYFEFQNTDLQTVANSLEGYFDIKIIVDEKMQNCRVTATFEAQELAEILVIIDKLLESNHKKDGGMIEIFGEKCQ